jgi:porin
MLGVNGGGMSVRVQHVHGKSLSGDLVGDGQVSSNIDAPDGLRLFEAWLSVPIAANTVVKAGLIDLNGIFDVQEVGSLFIHSSHGIGPDFSQSGLNGPSIFPTTSAAVVAEWQGRGVALRAGLFDAVAGNPRRPTRTVVRFPGQSGLLIVGEGEIKIAASAQIQVGGWAYTRRFDNLRIDEAGEPRGQVRSRGAYALVEGHVGTFRDRPINAWIRVGIADPDANPIGLYLGGGVAVGEGRSQWGIAMAHARLGSPARAPGATSTELAETAIDLTYVRAVGDHLTLQPNVQYVINPGWDRQLQDALVAGVRVTFQF